MLGLGVDATKVQDVINQACQKALKRKRPASGKWQSLEDRLLDCYIESCEGAPKDKRFCHGVHLLEKVVLQDNLSTLVVNLYPNNDGYSLMLKGKNGTESETVKLPYEVKIDPDKTCYLCQCNFLNETEFLDYLDSQELPPILVDLLEKSQANIFYSGCVIVEVRDYRQSPSASNYDTNYVLLRPTYQTLVCDVNALTADPKWTQDDKLALESQLLLSTEGPLCLDPSPEVCLVANQLQFNQKKFNSHALTSSLRQHSQAFQNRTAITSTNPSPCNLKLMDFLSHYKKPQPPVNLRLAKTPQTTDRWKQKPVHLGMPSRLDVELYTKMIERPKITNDNSPETVQEITLEGEKTNNRNYFCKVTIRRRPTDLQYLGELYLEEDTNSNNGSNQNRTTDESAAKRNGKACQFFLGSKLSAQKYLQQFQDLYTEEGRKSVKICSYMPGQQHSTQGTATNSQPSSTNQKKTQATQDAVQTEANSTDNSEENGASSTGSGVHASSSSQATLPMFANATVMSQAPVVHDSSNLSSLQTYGQKLAVFQQQGGVTGSAAQVVTVSSGSVIASSVIGGTKFVQSSNRKASLAQYVTTTSGSGVKSTGGTTSSKTQPSVLVRRQSQTDTNSTASRQSPTTPYPGVVGTYMQPVVGSVGVSVTLPAGVTVTVAGGTPIVSVNSEGAIAAGNLQAQFIGIKTTAQPIQPAPPTPLTLLQSQQTQLAQGRQPTTTFTLPGNLVPISQIPSVGSVATLNAQIQAKTSPQTTPTGQPTPILPNTPMSPPSGLTTVTINARPILPQQAQQQRKISGGRTLTLTSAVNRTVSNIQPLVPLGGQLPPGTQIPQQQFQVRIPVQFSPQAAQLQQTGQAQLQTSQQTIMSGQPIQIHAQPVSQTQMLQQQQVQVQVKQATQQGHGAQITGKAPSKSPGQRRRSQNK